MLRVVGVDHTMPRTLFLEGETVRANTVANASARFSVFTEEQCEAVFLATLEVVERTGVDISLPEAVALLKQAGARTDGSRVRIPSAMVKEALVFAPSRFTVYSRDLARSIRIEPNVVNYGPGPLCAGNRGE